MIIIGSPDIVNLDAEITWDISGTLPLISIVNLSTGSGLANTTTWFVATSPSGTPIHEGSQANPDETGVWTSHSITDNWPRPFGSIEWSGAPYMLTMYMQDGTGAIYSITKSATICRPAGNTSNSKNPYGLAAINLQVKCEQGRIWFEDTTNHTYKGLDGTQVSSILRVVYPIDDTGVLPDPFVLSNFSTALVPISYSSDNYQYLQSSIYDYDFGDYTHVRIKYQSKSKNSSAAVSFPVLCNIDLCPLICEVQKLITSIENGNCSDVETANQKLALINPKLILCLLGKQEPLCGIDVPKLIEEIKSIGGFDCDCCSTNTGIIPETSSVIDGYTFSIVSQGGDVGGTVSTTGTNIQFNLHDVKYIVKMCDDSPQATTAFTFTPSVSGDGYTKTYCLLVDVNQFGYDLAASISADGDLLNVWKALFGNTNNGDFDLIVDGGCIFSSGATYDYDFTLQNIPLNTTYALLSNINVGGVSYGLGYAFNLGNLAGLQNYLNGLGFGTFVVTNPSGQTVLITSTGNSTNINSIYYKISTTTFVADMTKVASGFTPMSANQVIQEMINYICGFNDTQVATSVNYQICYLDSTGTKQIVTIAEGVSLAAFIAELLLAGCTTIDYITTLRTSTCDGLKSIFGTSSLPIGNNDFIFGTKGGGACSRIAYADAFIKMLSLISTNTEIKTLFCQAQIDCAQGLICAPYAFLEVIVSSYDTTCSPIVGIETTIS